MKTLDDRNRLHFGLGTVGRDMFYSFEANTLPYFLSNVLNLPVWVFAAASLVLSVMRIFDAFNDPITGLLIDNIRHPWGKFKPAILVGGVLSAVFSVMIVAGYIVYLKKYKISEQFYAGILKDLEERETAQN